MNTDHSGNGFEDTCKYRLEIIAGLGFHQWDRQELISAIGIVGRPRAKSEETFSDEFLPSVDELKDLKHWHSTLDDVEPPTGETVLVSNEREEEVESELFGFEVSDPLFGTQSMVEPSEGSRNFSQSVGMDGNERFFKRHDWFSKKLMMSDVDCITCYMENRLAAFFETQKLLKLESLPLAKPSDLYHLYLATYFLQSARSAKIAETEGDSRKKIQQIKKVRGKEDSKLPSFTTRYSLLI
jgi:hypothetical protein